MGNPFLDIVGSHWDEWSGAFSCQQAGCRNVEKIAKYNRKEKLLTWKCADGHVSMIEDMDE